MKAAQNKFNSKMSSLLCGTCLVMLAACNSNTAPTPPPPKPPIVDNSPPVISMSASKVAVQGGETIAITVSVNDDTDTQVDFNLSCDGGVLNGEFLVIPETETDYELICTATAQDTAGNSASETLSIDVKATIVELSLFGVTKELTPGELGSVEVQNFELTEGSYTGKLGDVDIEFFRADGALVFSTPFDMPEGAQFMTIDLGDNFYSFEVNVGAVPIIDDAKAVVEDTFTQTINVINELLADNTLGLTQSQRDLIIAQKQEVQTQLDALDTFTDQEILETAQFIRANNILAGNSNANISKVTKATLEECGTVAREFFDSSVRNGVYIMAIAAGTGIVSVLATPLVGTVMGAIVTLDYLTFLSSTASPIELGPEAYSICKDAVLESLGVTFGDNNAEFISYKPNYQAGLSMESRVVFTNNQPQTITVQGRQQLFEEYRDLLPNAVNKVISLARSIEIVPQSLIAQLQDLLAPSFVDLEFDQIALSNISHNDITGALADGTITFTLNNEANSETNIDFSFDISQIDGPSETVQAQLNFLPEADDLLITVTAGETIASAVQTRGADSVRLVSSPQKGSVDLQVAGDFTYTANAGEIGDDNFTYEAVNAAGVSDPALVTIDIKQPLPTAGDLNFTVAVGETVTGTLPTTGADSVEILTFPTQGDFTIEGQKGPFQYTPREGASGTDTMTYQAVNSTGSSDPATVTFTIAEDKTAKFIGTYSVNITHSFAPGEITESTLIIDGGLRLNNVFVNRSFDGTLNEAGSLVYDEQWTFVGNAGDIVYTVNFTVSPNLSISGTVLVNPILSDAYTETFLGSKTSE